MSQSSFNVSMSSFITVNSQHTISVQESIVTDIVCHSLDAAISFRLNKSSGVRISQLRYGSSGLSWSLKSATRSSCTRCELRRGTHTSDLKCLLTRPLKGWNPESGIASSTKTAGDGCIDTFRGSVKQIYTSFGSKLVCSGQGLSLKGGTMLAGSSYRRQTVGVTSCAEWSPHAPEQGSYEDASHACVWGREPLAIDLESTAKRRVRVREYLPPDSKRSRDQYHDLPLRSN